MKLQRDVFLARNGLSYGEYAAEIRPFRTAHMSRRTRLLGRADRTSTWKFLLTASSLRLKELSFLRPEAGMVPDVSVWSTTSDHPTALPVHARGNFPETWIGV
jgi:hypothetical protein